MNEMDIKLKLRIKTPYGIATKIKVNSEGEIVFVASVKGKEKDQYGFYKYIDKEFSLSSCVILAEEDVVDE